MSLPRVSVVIVALLLVGLLIPPALFSQNRPPQVERIASAVSELFKERPLEPKPENQAEDAESDPAKEKPPADDAPINELIVYWRTKHYEVVALNKDKPSDKVRERILEACENRPWLFGQLTHVLPETQETYDRVRQLLAEAEKESGGENWQQQLRHWLKTNSGHFREELIEDVRHLSRDNRMDISSVYSLARLDWEVAKPLVEAMANGEDPFRAAQAWGMIYNQTQRGGDAAQIESLRAQLKAKVVNRQSQVSVRQTAFQNLMSGEWSGQEEWYLSLFADPLLNGVRPEAQAKSDTNPTGIAKFGQRERDDAGGFDILWLPVQQNPAKWLPTVTRLIGSNDRPVHLAAVGCLTAYLTADSTVKEQTLQAARALLPWLTDPNWGGQQDRWSYLGSLTRMELPESLPGLIWVLDNDEDATCRAVAAEAVIRYRNPQANPALRRALARENNEVLRDPIIAALAQAGAQSGGFSDEEAVAAIETYARRIVTPEGKKEISEIADLQSEKALPLPVSIGRVYDEREDMELGESLAAKLFARAKALRSSEPAAARKMLSIAERCNLAVADLNLIERIGEGVVDLDGLKLALESRERIRKRATDELSALLKKGGYAAGIAAVLAGEEDSYNELLKGKDANAQIALLAAARYVREALPVETVGKLLSATQTQSAAENYLEVEDGAEARRLIWAKHPGEARVLGERIGADAAMGGPPVTQWEEKLRKEVLGANGPEEVYAVVSNFNPGIHDSRIIRVRNGQAELSLHNSEGRRLMRRLTANELSDLKEFTSREEVENLRPQDRRVYAELETDRVRYQYLRLTKQGGRRIRLNAGLRPTPKKDATLMEQLTGMFYQLSRAGEFKLRYEMEDRIPGLEVLLADDNRRVFTVCREGAELRVLIEPEKDDTVRANKVRAEWHSFVAGQLGASADEPRNCGYQNGFLNMPDWLQEFRRRTGAMPDWRSKSGEAWFAPAYVEGEPGIWKLEESKNPVKVIGGTYLNAIATPDGKWLTAKKTVQREDKFEMQVTRIQTATGREFIVNAPQIANHYPLAFVAAHNKILLGQGYFQYGRDFTGGTYFLLDAETGALLPVKGEFRPLQDQTARPLQRVENSADKPNQFWAAIYDKQKNATVIGRYDARLFAFTPAVELPELRLGSSDIWADAAAGKVYVAYQGHLLRVPLTK